MESESNVPLDDDELLVVGQLDGARWWGVRDGDHAMLGA